MNSKSSSKSNIESIASRVVLATLSTSAWRATRLHKEETKAERERHKSEAPKVLVKICDHDALTELAKLHSEAYHTHRRITMPTVQDGMRLLPASRQFEHSDTMRKLADKHREIVARFMRDYDAIKAAAPDVLNGLFDESMWPSHREVESRFGFGTRYLACPVDGAWGEWLSESARVAEDALRDRLREALERVRDRVKGDGKLYGTVFSNLAEIITMVPDLNFTGAADLAEVAKLAAPLAQHDAESVRDDDKARAKISRDAGRILTMLGGVK